MSDNLKKLLQKQIDLNLRKSDSYRLKQAKIDNQIRKLKELRDKLHVSERKLKEITDDLIRCYNDDEPVQAFNKLRKNRLEEMYKQNA